MTNAAKLKIKAFFMENYINAQQGAAGDLATFFNKTKAEQNAEINLWATNKKGNAQLKLAGLDADYAAQKAYAQSVLDDEVTVLDEILTETAP
jgi:hypothetical protein